MLFRKNQASCCATCKLLRSMHIRCCWQRLQSGADACAHRSVNCTQQQLPVVCLQESRQVGDAHHDPPGPLNYRLRVCPCAAAARLCTKGACHEAFIEGSALSLLPPAGLYAQEDERLVGRAGKG